MTPDLPGLTAPSDPLGLHLAASEVVVRGDDAAYAYFSPDMKYRYALGRSWHPTKPIFAVCMLNPSTADERVVDPTVRKCLHFAQRDGYGSLVVVNLFALRATDPTELLAEHKRGLSPVGSMNDHILTHVFLQTNVAAAWGVPKWDFVKQRIQKVLDLHMTTRDHVTKWRGFGTSKDGHPKHPCYLANDTPIQPWNP